MSKAHLEKFIEQVRNDPSMLREASREERDVQKFVTDVVSYARVRGYDFTEEETKQWIDANTKQHAEGELTDAQLGDVAGGTGPVRWSLRSFFIEETGILRANVSAGGPGTGSMPDF